jgi:hypothetical protein
LLLARRFQLAEQHDVGASSSLPTSLASLLGPDLTRAVGSYLQLPCLIWFQDTLFGGLETDVQPSSPISLSCSRTCPCVLRTVQVITEGLAIVGALSSFVAMAGFHHVSVFFIMCVHHTTSTVEDGVHTARHP